MTTIKTPKTGYILLILIYAFLAVPGIKYFNAPFPAQALAAEESDAEAIFQANKLEAKKQGEAIMQAWTRAAKGTRARPVYGEAVQEWAFAVATRGDFNDTKAWMLGFDPKVSGRTVPENIGGKIESYWKINEDFKKMTLSWDVANLVNPVTAPAESPVIWTRGLKSDGTWGETDGVFGSAGGFIGFADGSVKWFPALRDEKNPRGKLVRYGESMPTFDISQAVRGGSRNILKNE